MYSDHQQRVGSSLYLQRKTLKFREVKVMASVTQLLSGSSEGQSSGLLTARPCAMCSAHAIMCFFDIGFSEPGGAGPGGCWS